MATPRRSDLSVPIEALRIDAFSGGINTSAPANEIADNEVVSILNMEFDESDNLVVRNGVVASVGLEGIWDQSIWDQGTWDASASFLYTKRITSILDFENESGFVGILYTTGVKLFSRTLGGTITDLTGVLNLPDNVRWYWRILNGVAVGVNGMSTGHNPIKVVGPAPGTASHLSAAPKGNFIEVWNDRMWIARADFPNQIQASNIGDAELWDTDAGANPAHGAIFEIDRNEGDEITGLYSTKERLFIFKKKSIYVAFPENPALPATDLRNIKIEKYAANIGCIAASTIQAVFDDVLFLSNGGIASLSAAQVVADFQSAIISSKIKDISAIRKDVAAEDVFAFTVVDKHQYWLSVAAVASPTNQNIVYVLDYRQVKNGIIRWVTFDTLAFGTAMEVFDHGTDQLIYLLGCQGGANIFFIGTYTPRALVKVFNDSGVSYRKSVLTKAYDFDTPDIRKLLKEWFLGLSLDTASLSLSVSYLYNEDTAAAGVYSLSLSGVFGGTFYDVANWDVGLFDNLTQGLNNDLIRRSFLYNDKGRKALSVQFNILNNQVDQGFKIKSFGIKYGRLSEYKAQTA